MEKQITLAGRQPIFTLPFTRDQLRLDLQNIILGEMRRLRQLTLEDAVLPLPKSDQGFEFWDPSCTAEESGISYEQISKFTLVEACEDYFDYGFYAVTGTRSEPIQFDTIHTWIGAYLDDLSSSNYFEQWDAEGQKGLSAAIKRCMYLCELANARKILEGEDEFWYFRGPDREDEPGQLGLSIRQLAMLSGMEEMSLRSYISRKTTPVLEVCKSDRKTYVEVAAAKKWLIEKGRYLPVQTGRRSAEIDLSKTGFNDFNEFAFMLRDRLAYMADKSDNRASFEQSVNSILKSFNIDDMYGIKPQDATNDELLDHLSHSLDLPSKHLKHRAKEASLKSEILLAQYQLKQLQQQSLS